MEEILIEIRSAAHDNDWVEIDNQENIKMISFVKGTMRINVYYGKPWRMTVGTVLNHPITGRNQLFRKYVRMPELRRIFYNPRTHTQKGYRRSR
jgi:hypothetical protein